jgi:uncharacterized protein YraI
MKRRICLMAAIIVVTGLAAIDFTPARATITGIDLQVRANPSTTYVHCRRVYHCHWTTRVSVVRVFGTASGAD